jgi:hypothetical protein
VDSETGLTDVKVSFRTISHIYDSDDPSPEDKRELTDRAEKAIGKSITEFLKTVPKELQGSLIIMIPESDMIQGRDTSLVSAVRYHFSNREKDLKRDMKIIRWEGMREFRLSIAIFIPAIIGIGCTTLFSKDYFALIIQNILVIFSWVVIWQPFQTLVFDRWTVSIKRRIFKHITKMDIRVISNDSV